MIRLIIITFAFSITLAQSKYDRFNAYWYAGKAELTSYELKQARYGEIHTGHAVLIFVSEDFSKKKQVKLDYPGNTPQDKVSVLKLNLTKKFNTGVYPYSMMSSVFTPINIDQQQPTLKVTSSSQEWCGHTFTQLNRVEDGLRFQMHSYFESEGEADYILDDTLLEDEIWNMIRLNPDFLPKGTIKLIPGTLFSRLLHKTVKPIKAEATLDEIENGKMKYTIEYAKINRTLTIYFNSAFPYEIEKWEERTHSGFGSNQTELVTTAVLKKRIMLDYWSKNSNQDLHYREKLGLK